MSEKQLSGILVLLVPQIIKEITDNEKIAEDAATENFYNSKVYSVLENEETKLWHLSPKALYELYKQEKQTGKIDFPEEA
ncbi:MAG: hypothetical protein KBT46_09885 [Ruminococcus sp.]|nr:hypothetical protein [Candidatus Copronaster equi]